jgi:hypothetical protein
MNSAGELLVVDKNNNLIRKVDASGTVTTFAGTGTAGYTNAAALSSDFDTPTGIIGDASGNLYIAEYINHVVRKIDSSGNVTLFSGNPGIPGYVDGPGTEGNCDAIENIGLVSLPSTDYSFTDLEIEIATPFNALSNISVQLLDSSGNVIFGPIALTVGPNVIDISSVTQTEFYVQFDFDNSAFPTASALIEEFTVKAENPNGVDINDPLAFDSSTGCEIEREVEFCVIKEVIGGTNVPSDFTLEIYEGTTLAASGVGPTLCHTFDPFDDTASYPVGEVGSVQSGHLIIRHKAVMIVEVTPTLRAAQRAILVRQIKDRSK